MASTKNILLPSQVITGGDMSTATVTSLVTTITGLDNLSYQLVWTGSPVGTFDLQGSNTYAPGIGGTVLNAGTWTSVTLSPAPVASGSGGNLLLNLDGLGFAYVRMVYTKTSGTGTLNGTIAGKGV